MSTRVQHPLAADYLDRLRRAARRLPRDRRDELVADIEAHLAETIRPDAGDAEALTVLDRLGAPEDIVEAEQPRPEPTADPRGIREWAAIFLLAFGGLVMGFGWLVSAILLWSSPAWRTRDKWIGTLVVPGGLATTLLAFMIFAGGGGETCSSANGGPERCTGGLSATMEVVYLAGFPALLLAPLATAVYLARRAGRPSAQ